MHFGGVSADCHVLGLNVEVGQNISCILSATYHNVHNLLRFVSNREPAGFAFVRGVRGQLRVGRLRQRHTPRRQLCPRVLANQRILRAAVEQQVLDFAFRAVFVGQRRQYGHRLVVGRVIRLRIHTLLGRLAVIKRLCLLEVPDVGGERHGKVCGWEARDTHLLHFVDEALERFGHFFHHLRARSSDIREPNAYCYIEYSR